MKPFFLENMVLIGSVHYFKLPKNKYYLLFKFEKKNFRTHLIYCECKLETCFYTIKAILI